MLVSALTVTFCALTGVETGAGRNNDIMIPKGEREVPGGTGPLCKFH